MPSCSCRRQPYRRGPRSTRSAHLHIGWRSCAQAVDFVLKGRKLGLQALHFRSLLSRRLASWPVLLALHGRLCATCQRVWRRGCCGPYDLLSPRTRPWQGAVRTAHQQLAKIDARLAA